MQLIEKAIEISAKAHDRQYRKASDIPYVAHPFMVGMILLEAGCSEEVVAAGILHDTIEDTEIREEELKEIFGEKITALVIGASEENKNLPWEERKTGTIKKLETASKDLCMIVCADKLHNLRSLRFAIETDGESIWNNFNRGRNKQEWYYREIYNRLEKPLAGMKMLEQFKKEIARVFDKDIQNQ